MIADMTAAFDAIRQEIHYAYEAVAFFRRHMDSAGLHPNDIVTRDDLSRLPPTRKADYRRGFPANVLASGYTLASRHVSRFQSSGTEDERLVSVVLSYDLARRQATCLGFNPRFQSLWEPGLRMRTCRYAAPNCSDVECSNPNSTMQSRMLADRTLVLPVYHDLMTTPTAMTERALDEIADYDPHLLFVDPTHFAFLTRAMRRLGRAPHKRDGFCINSGYTLCTQVARRQIRAAYGDRIPFADMLGMSEIGYLGFECPAGRTHLNTTDYYVEFVRGGRPAEPGELAELVLTTLGDRLSPHIRYATGDLFRVDPSPCPCGSRALVVSAEGRAKNALRGADGDLVTPLALDKAIGPAPCLDVYRMTQIDESEFQIRYVPSDAWTPTDAADLRERLCDRLMTNNIACVPTHYLSADRGGKFISCVSLLAPTPGLWS